VRGEGQVGGLQQAEAAHALQALEAPPVDQREERGEPSGGEPLRRLAIHVGRRAVFDGADAAGGVAPPGLSRDLLDVRAHVVEQVHSVEGSAGQQAAGAAGSGNQWQVGRQAADGRRQVRGVQRAGEQDRPARRGQQAGQPADGATRPGEIVEHGQQRRGARLGPDQAEAVEDVQRGVGQKETGGHQ